MSELTLIAKIAKAALDVGGKLKADKTNKEQNYSYISADKILAICGQALSTQGIVIVPGMAKQDITLYEYTDSYGKAKKRYDATAHLTFAITDGVTTQEALWFGVGSDYTVPDKALYKAITSGHKYFLAKLLCIGEGNEDSEHEPAEDEREQKQTAKTTYTTQPEKMTTTSRQAEITQELGFEATVTEAPKAEAPKAAPAKMNVGDAMNELSSDGTPYGGLQTPDLVNRLNSMLKLKGTPKATPEHARKILAIQTILEARNGK